MKHENQCFGNGWQQGKRLHLEEVLHKKVICFDCFSIDISSGRRCYRYRCRADYTTRAGEVCEGPHIGCHQVPGEGLRVSRLYFVLDWRAIGCPSTPPVFVHFLQYSIIYEYISWI